MEIHERDRPIGAGDKYYAHFKRCEVIEGNFLRGAYGDGATGPAAIRDYAAKISGRKIVIGAYLPTRLEIQVPILT